MSRFDSLFTEYSALQQQLVSANEEITHAVQKAEDYATKHGQEKQVLAGRLSAAETGLREYWRIIDCEHPTYRPAHLSFNHDDVRN